MAFTVAIGGISVLIATGIAFRRQILEQWWLWKLESAEESSRYDAAQALGELRSVKAIPRLMELFREKCNNYYGALYHPSFMALIEIGTPAVPEFIAALKDENIHVRIHAAQALWRIEATCGDVGNEAVKALIERIEDENEIVRREAVMALGSFGMKAKEAIPGLVQAINDENRQVRKSAAEALSKIQGERGP